MIFIIAVVIIIIILSQTSKGKTDLVKPQNEKTEYRSITEIQPSINNRVETENFSSQLLEGIIKDFDKKAHIGTINSNGKIYDIIFQGNKNYSDFPNSEPKAGNKVTFRSQTINGYLYATDIMYVNSGIGKQVDNEGEGVKWSKENLEIKNMDMDTLYYLLSNGLRDRFGNVYISSYACPVCSSPLYKTVFPVGEEYPIEIQENVNSNSVHIHKMKRVFTCTQCKSYFTSAKSRLSEGTVYQLNTEDDKQYFQLFDEFNEKGTTEGRTD